MPLNPGRQQPLADDKHFLALARRYESANDSPVPIFSASPNGKFVKRYWAHRHDGWCDACGEPIPVWVQHMGRMDHSLLDAHYNSMADYPHRRWSAGSVLTDARRRFGVKASATAWMQVASDGEHARRTHIHALVCWLRDQGALDLGQLSDGPLASLGAGLQGSMVQFNLFPKIILQHFPNGSVAMLSDIMCFVLANYNMETVYDLCSFASIDDAVNSADTMEDLPPFAAKAAAARSFGSVNEGAADDGGGEPAEEAGAGSAVGFSRKGSFVRGILGQLRHLYEGRDDPLGREILTVHRAAAAELCRHIIVESFFVRTAEYSVRMEPVWQRHGCEQLRADASLYSTPTRRDENPTADSACFDESPRYTAAPCPRVLSTTGPAADPRQPHKHARWTTS
jgi:hypothetical protein